jgi:hypothetical protein
MLATYWVEASQSCARGQAAFATAVTDYSPGPGFGIFDSSRILGSPRGAGRFAGSLDVTSLGVGGSITLGFDVALQDGPGADLVIFENAFLTVSGVFSEVAFVEVSTDGVHFARFPARYSGPPGPLPAFSGLPMGSYPGFSGAMPVLANALTNSHYPGNPIEAGGEALDLGSLRGHPLVRSGQVDLQDLNHVRLVDVPEGACCDSQGNLIWDHGGPGASADFDAVGLLNHSDNQNASRPFAFFETRPGSVDLVLGDPDGVLDLNWQRVRWSASLEEFPFAQFLQHAPPASWSLRQVRWRLVLPATEASAFGSLAVQVEDAGGGQAVAQLQLDGRP